MRGGPKKTKEEKRTNFINVRLNNSEKEKLEFLSENQGISKHQVIRNGIELQHREILRCVTESEDILCGQYTDGLIFRLKDGAKI